MQDNNTRPYLTVVAASRNDDHGGDPLVRTQIFINSFAWQCEKFELSAELVIVDWNPVPDRPGLAAMLRLPQDIRRLEVRVITVPSSLHNKFKYCEGMPLLQMIAKNTGIRRAKGAFVLATNIDIVFSDELIQFIALQRLDPERLYRVDRYDIQNGLTPEATSDEITRYAWSHVIRSQQRFEPQPLIEHLYNGFQTRRCVPGSDFRGGVECVDVVHEDGAWQIRPHRFAPLSHLHTNACGDFTLLSRNGWETIRGYPEFTGYSFHIDSMGLVAAHYSGYQEVSLLPPCVCFHIEHALGSGWTPEGQAALFNRLRAAGVLNPDLEVLMPLIQEMQSTGRALQFNHAGWGLMDFVLPEQALGDTAKIPDEQLLQLARQAETRRLSAVEPEYDLDRLTLAHERQKAVTRLLHGATDNVPAKPTDRPIGSVIQPRSERAVLYIPDSEGGYREDHAISYMTKVASWTRLVFLLHDFARQFPLRFDPCECPGLIRIDSITALDVHHGKIIWQLSGRGRTDLRMAGTAAEIEKTPRAFAGFQLLSRRNKKPPLLIFSTGPDPQIILPPLRYASGSPFVVFIEMHVIPSA